jgi:hypothetical protein
MKENPNIFLKKKYTLLCFMYFLIEYC